MAGLTTLYDEAAIARRVNALAAAIAEAVPRDVVIVALLKGSFVFIADLVRALDRRGLEPRIEFLWLSSYGHGREPSGDIKLLGPVPGALEGRTVLLIDDVADTGLSLVFARRCLREAGAARVSSCVLLDKPSRRTVEFTADFVGFTIGDVFVVGYGIDYAERYRHLPYIAALA